MGDPKYQILQVLSSDTSMNGRALPAVSGLDVVALINQGIAFHRQGQLEHANQIYAQVLAHQADNFDALHLSGVIAMQSENATLAVELIAKAMEINPNHASAYSNLGIAYKKLQRLEQALDCFDRAIKIKLDYTEAHFNRGNTLKDLNLLGEALDSYADAIKLKPDFAEAHFNNGVVLNNLNRIADALASFDRAIDIRPEYAEVYFSKSLSLLLSGELRPGWLLYEWRWKQKDRLDRERKFPQPLWLGQENIPGKTLLLHAEQGLGDTIQFCRYAKLVKERGAQVILEVSKSLLGLLDSLEGVDNFVEQGKALPDFDYHCPLPSLPLAFDTSLSSIPCPTAYLAANAGKLEEWSNILGKKSKPRVGLMWNGNAQHKNDHNRSLALQQLLPHLPDSCEYVSLQKDVRDVDTQALVGSSIRHYGSQLSDFTDTAALCELMDLVITVDTSVAHLAGAIGKRTWVLLPYAPDWRWLLNRDDSPWYASMRLYRQAEYGEWHSILEKIKIDITNARWV